MGSFFRIRTFSHLGSYSGELVGSQLAVPLDYFSVLLSASQHSDAHLMVQSQPPQRLRHSESQKSPTPHAFRRPTQRFPPQTSYHQWTWSLQQD